MLNLLIQHKLWNLSQPSRGSTITIVEDFIILLTPIEHHLFVAVLTGTVKVILC